MYKRECTCVRSLCIYERKRTCKRKKEKKKKKKENRLKII